MKKLESIRRFASGAVAAALIVLGLAACGGERDSSEAPQEEYSSDDRRDLEVTVRLAEMLSQGPEALARFEGELPGLDGSRQARLRAEIEGLETLLDALDRLDEAWAEADDRQRDALAPQIDALLQQADAALDRAEVLVGPEST